MVVGREIRPCRMWLVAPTSSTDVLLTDLLKVNASEPPPSILKPSPTPLQAVDRVDF